MLLKKVAPCFLDCYNLCFIRCSGGGKKENKKDLNIEKETLKACIYNDYCCFYSCVINCHYVLQ